FLRDTKSKNKKIIFFGDSITQAGMLQGGYISLLKNILARQGILNYDIIGAGINGDKIYDLYLRMREDVIIQSPDITVIWIGVNDVWHKSTNGTGTDADKFEKFYTAVIKELLASKIKLMLVTPAVIGEKNDHSDQQNIDLNTYAQIIRDIAKDYSLAVCDLRAIFHLYEMNNNLSDTDSGILTTDGVHLNAAGNKLVAEEMWKVLKEI
ncbi:MAG: GDSL-type esterase/lipase family protein, partial [Parafilimonas sp.]